MVKNRNAANCFVFFIIIFLWALESRGMEEDPEDISASTGSMTNLRSVNLLNPDQDGEGYDQFISNKRSPAEPNTDLANSTEHKDGQLGTYFESVNRVPASPAIRQVVGGLSGCVAWFPSAGCLTPLATTLLENVANVTTDVIPTTPLYPALMAIPPAVATGMVAYDIMGEIFMSQPPDIVAARKTVTERPDAGLSSFANGAEAWTYSWSTNFIRLIFFGGLYLAVNLVIQSNLDPSWGDDRGWAVGFTVLIAPILYLMLIRPANNPNKSLWRPWTKEGKEKQPCLDAIDSVKDIIRHKGLTDKTSELGGMLKVIPLEKTNVININGEDKAVEQSTSENQDSLIVVQNNNTQNESEDQKLPLKQSQEKTYVQILKKILKVADECPTPIKTWRYANERISRGVSTVASLAELPMTYLLSYYLSHQVFNLFTYPAILNSPVSFLHISPEIAMGLGIGTAIITAPSLTLAVFKETILIKDEIYQLLDWFYKPRLTSSYIGERLAPGLSRFAAGIYFAGPIAYFLSETVLEKGMGIDNVGAKMVLIIPLTFKLGTASSRFFDQQFNKLANWFAKGGQVSFGSSSKRILCCLDREGKKRQAIMLLGRLEEIREKVVCLNLAYIEQLNQQIGITLIPTEKDLLLRDES